MRPDFSAITIRILIVAVACLGLLRAGSEAADGDTNVAGLMVDYGDGRVSYALIPFTGDTISGMDLLDRSELPLVTIDFGGMGAGVCMIEQVGCDVSACRLRMCQTSDPDSAFWQLMRQNDQGDWVFAPRGVSGTQLHDGEVSGWFWTGNTPTGPAPSVDDIATRLDVDLQSMRTTDTHDRTLMTFGTSDIAPAANDRWAIVSGICILGGIVTLGSFALIRTRGTARS